MTEAKIQADVVQFLQSKKIFCHSVPNELAGGGPNAKVRMMKFIAMGLRKGVADLVVWWPDGKIGYVEMKDAKGTQKQAQKAFEQKCHEYGARYDLCRSVDDVARLVEVYSGFAE